MWSSDRKCYVDRHGIDPRDDCSLLIFFSEVNTVHCKYCMTKKEIIYLSSPLTRLEGRVSHDNDNYNDDDADDDDVNDDDDDDDGDDDDDVHVPLLKNYLLYIISYIFLRSKNGVLCYHGENTSTHLAMHSTR